MPSLLIFGGVPAGADVTGPVIDMIAPAPLSVITPDSAVTFRVTDDVALDSVSVVVNFPSGGSEIIFEADVFSSLYAGSTYDVGTGIFVIQRLSGWPSAPSISINALDTSANLTNAVLNYNLEAQAVAEDAGLLDGAPHCLEHVPDHPGEALDRILKQFKQSGVLKTIIRIINEEVQELEDAAWALLHARSLPDAFGVFLEAIGDLNLAKRSGLTDDAEYRLFIAAMIDALNSNGSGDELLQLVRDLTDGPGTTIELTEYPPHTVFMHVGGDGFGTFPPDLVFSVLVRAKKAAVRLLLIYQPINDGAYFKFSGGDTFPVIGATTGFADAGGSGGRFVTSIAAA